MGGCYEEALDRVGQGMADVEPSVAAPGSAAGVSPGSVGRPSRNVGISVSAFRQHLCRDSLMTQNLRGVLVWLAEQGMPEGEVLRWLMVALYEEALDLVGQDVADGEGPP